RSGIIREVHDAAARTFGTSELKESRRGIEVEGFAGLPPVTISLLIATIGLQQVLVRLAAKYLIDELRREAGRFFVVEQGTTANGPQGQGRRGVIVPIQRAVPTHQTCLHAGRGKILVVGQCGSQGWCKLLTQLSP